MSPAHQANAERWDGRGPSAVTAFCEVGALVQVTVREPIVTLGQGEGVRPPRGALLEAREQVLRARRSIGSNLPADTDDTAQRSRSCCTHASRVTSSCMLAPRNAWMVVRHRAAGARASPARALRQHPSGRPRAGGDGRRGAVSHRSDGSSRAARINASYRSLERRHTWRLGGRRAGNGPSAETMRRWRSCLGTEGSIDSSRSGRRTVTAPPGRGRDSIGLVIPRSGMGSPGLAGISSPPVSALASSFLARLHRGIRCPRRDDALPADAIGSPSPSMADQAIGYGILGTQLRRSSPESHFGRLVEQ